MTTALTERFDQALTYAVALHRTDVRKGELESPYVGHLLAVCATVLGHGGTEDQAVAALLHDSAEDHGGADRLDDLGATFGAAVADLVRDVSDSLVDTALVEKPPWWERKVAYIAHAETLAERQAPALLISAADKLDNMRATLGDCRAAADPTEVFSIFNEQSKGRVGWLWYHRRLHEAFTAGIPTTMQPQRRVVDEIGAVLADMVALIAQHDPDADLAAEATEAAALESATRAALGL